MPATFAPDASHYDAQKVPEVNGIPLLKHIESTPWSRKAQLNGRDVASIKVHELAYRGWHEHALRHLSHGRFVSLVFCKSVSESVFVSRLLQSVRTKGLDLDACATEAFRVRHPGAAIADKREAASDFMAPLVEALLTKLQEMSPKAQEDDAIKELQELRAKVQVLESQSSPLPEVNKRKEPPSSSRYSTPKKKQAVDVSQTKLSFPSSASAISVKTEDEEEEDATQDQPHHAFSPTGPVLLQHPLRGSAKKTVEEWLKALQSSLENKSQRDDFQIYLSRVSQVFDRMEENLRPDLQELAVRWGLPMQLATKLPNSLAIKVVAAASFLAS